MTNNLCHNNLEPMCMRGEQFAPTHAHFAFTKRMVDPHTDPEANCSQRKGKKDQPGRTDKRENKNLRDEWLRAFTHEWPFYAQPWLPVERKLLRRVSE